MSEIRYTADHEWVSLDGDVATVGITDYAEEQLGDLVYVELPSVGREVTAGDETAVLESVKAAGDVKSPVSGTIVEVNEALSDAPEKVNENPTGEGWFFRVQITNAADLETLMDRTGYDSLIASLA
ncbi:MAG TPA: glycine cleavage system protein GcvH [Gammaproteobacteria bacterium]|jgi:glycine cleavage system H protein|nr:glycine cleavage system protein GcvH [Arenicellales bacterium]MDP6855593.1 glycine cleavage system protein GcvH [Arenicellales bacterium]MDP6949147.1 glycine cleavage system protein GcvH [Arenicellales bacterium]HCY14001.1 glycine cleavage system protein GcvH [Gammaproteobacteria bacterium]|tara:strand:- start:543 stop:920 length:378 start_codon:yes stop_codon:yes gene_type:complete